VGIEATGSMQWFLELMEELGIDCQVGHPAKIRAAEPRKQKHDRRDAALVLQLLVENRFPSIWMPSREQRDVRSLILYRHQWVRIRTRVQNALQAIALSHGLRRGSSLWSEAGQRAIASLSLTRYTAERRTALQALYRHLEEQIEDLNRKVEALAWQRPQARRLMTHPGVGPITALATETFLGEPKRFVDGGSGQLCGTDPQRTLQRRATAIGRFEQTRESAATFSVVRSGGACGSQGCGVAAFLSAQAGAERSGESESGSGTQAGDPTLDPAA
jgi:transposase